MNKNTVLGAAIFLVTIVVAGGGLLLRRSSIDTAQNPAEQDQQLAQQLRQQFRRDEPLTVMLYYPSEGMLATGSAVVKRLPDTQSQARESLVVMLADQRASSVPALRDIKLREFYLDASGTAYIDLATGPQKNVLASAWEEQLAIFALTNTLQQNFDEIKQVVFLIEGRDAQTLAGHMDLSRTFTKRLDLVKQ